MFGLGVVVLPRAARAEPEGLTLEGGFGGGFVTGGPFDQTNSVTFGGSVAAGMWLSPRLALTGRVALTTYGEVKGDDSSDARYWFAGPSAQRWLTDWAWVSGGAGLAVYQQASDGGAFTSSGGVGLDLRAGLAFDLIDSSRHRFEVFVEVAPAVFRYIPRSLPPPPAEWDTYISTTFNVGYQFR